MAFLAAICEGISISLLIPVIKGILTFDFSFVYKLPVLGSFVAAFVEPSQHRNAYVFSSLILLIFITATGKSVLQYLSNLAVSYQIRRFSSQLRKAIYRRYLCFGKLFFDKSSTGHLHQILIGYTNQIGQEFKVLHNVIFSVLVLCVYLALMARISWQLTFVVLIAFPALHFSLSWLIRKIEKTSSDFAAAYSEMGRNIANALLCIPLVKIYSNEIVEEKHFEHMSERVRMFQFSIDKKQLLIQPIQEMILLFMTLLLVGTMAFLLIKERIGDVADYTVFFILLRRSAANFGTFNNALSSIAGVNGPINEILQIFDDKNKYFVPEGKKEFTQIERSIDFERLNYSFPNGVHVFRDLTCSFLKGKTTAIVGSSGSGKTTLINLILRFYDCPSESIFIDGTDIREFAVSSLHNKMALVAQETPILNTSLRGNLVYGLDKNITEQEIRAAIEKARLRDLLDKIPDGLDSLVGERGLTLSGGEKQRISIARAILKKAELLILDEATSALDSAMERLVQEAIGELIEGKTTIMIAHRLSTVKNADQIIVLENGSIVEKGSPDQLLSKKGKFFEYCQHQDIIKKNKF